MIVKKDLIWLIETGRVCQDFPITWEKGERILTPSDFKIARSLGLVSDRPPIDWCSTFFNTSNTCFLISIVLSFAVLMSSLQTSSFAVRVVGFLGGTALGVAAAKEIQIYREKQ